MAEEHSEGSDFEPFVSGDAGDVGDATNSDTVVIEADTQALEGSAPETTVDERKPRRRLKWMLGIVGGLVVALGGATAGYSYYFSTHALPRVTVGGESVATQTAEELTASLTERYDNASVTATFDDGTVQTYQLADLGASFDVEATVATVMEPCSSFADRLTALIQPREVEPVITIDQATFDAQVGTLNSMLGTPVQEAAVVLNADGTAFEVTPAVAGESVNSEQLMTGLNSAANTLSSTAVTVNTLVAEPTFTTESAEVVSAWIAAMLSTDVGIDPGNGRRIVPDDAQRASWVTIAYDDPAVPTASIDLGRVTEWVNAVADEYNRAPTTGVQMVNSAGTVIGTRTQAVDGRAVTNVDAVAALIQSSMNGGTAQTGTFEFTTTPATYEQRLVADGAENLVYQAAPGERWIDINLSSATVTAYEGGTPQRVMLMVPGAPATPTVTGTFNVWLQVRMQDMRGLNADGTPYLTEDVPWATYFYGDYAMHGAPWRSSFGWSGPGGSHGCVNMRVSDAQWVYDFVSIGTTVVSHY